MRRFFIFLILLITLAAVFRLSRIADDWHYIISAEPGELIYATSFDGDMSDWTQEEGTRLSTGVVDGAMQIAVTTPGSGIFSVIDPYMRNFDLSVAAKAVDGPEDNGYGVVFRQRQVTTYSLLGLFQKQSRNDYYIFLISSDGYYQVKRIYDGSEKIVSNWNRSDAINQGVGAENLIRIVAYEDQFRFFINGEQVQLCIPDDPAGESTPLSSGECRGGSWQDTLTDALIPDGRLGVTVQVGLTQPTGVVVEFDDFVVYGVGQE